MWTRVFGPTLGTVARRLMDLPDEEPAVRHPYPEQEVA